METIFIYLLKANSLIIIFYLTYYFLVQKETFFNSNRWFLLLGLFSSVSIPFFFIKKTILVNTPTNPTNPIESPLKANSITPMEASQLIDWTSVIVVIYGLISLFLLVKIIIAVISFFKLIKNKKATFSKYFTLVDIDENINPFSFFKYIVFNSSKYSTTELENILNHEKIHSKEKHSIDVLIAKFFCTLFWFNPFIWLYKKAIIENLEYIADKKATQNIEDKKAYQMTLLKVVTDHNYLSITNSFYQSLIKKRIVMLNKNQSKQKNVWKYAIIVPALAVFILLFQVKVIAQEKKVVKNDNSSPNTQIHEMIWTKSTPEDEMQSDVESMKNFGIEVNYSNVKRNEKGEIISIAISFKDKEGRSGHSEFEYEDGIKPIVLRKEINGNNQSKISLAEQAVFEETYDVADAPAVTDMPSPPAPPAPPAMNFSDMPKPPAAPDFPANPNIQPPKNINDKKAWKKFEEKMKKFEEAWNTPEIKKYEAEMAVYEKEMKEYEKNVLPDYEEQMKKYEMQMAEYEKQMKKYEENLEANFKKTSKNTK